MARLPAKGRPAVAKAPLQRGGQAPYKVRPPAGMPPASTIDCGHVEMGGCPRRVRKGQPPVASPQGPVASGQVARGGCPRRTRKGWLPATHPQGAAARDAPVRGLSPTARSRPALPLSQGK
ncbi:hypothetical protein BHM03_00056689 [Ensete ventricosum]|nr:hypothetical protein BHM03_00056689 [Ensete ventricosum]